jgi:NAD+ diphosphatase
MPFIAGVRKSAAAMPQALCFGFQAGKILLKVEEGRLSVPTVEDAAAFDRTPFWTHYFGEWDGRPCCAVCLPEELALSEGFTWKGLRELFGQLDEGLVWVAGRAGQLVHWHRNHRFCGRCGSLTQDHADERAKICPGCGLINYPRVSPAIIVAVVKDRQLLLAHSTRFSAKFFSVLAGFVEPGENLEDCVRREVFEEVGVRVRDIRYFGSQPWPFPDSLMVAFTADYAGGEIRVDPVEIADAGWFSAGGLPAIPPRISIARRLIDWFVAAYGE